VVVNALAIFWVTRGLDSKSLMSGSNGFTRGQPDRDRRLTTAYKSNVVTPKATLSGGESPSNYGYFPTTSFADPPHKESRNHDIESGHRRAPSNFKTLKSISGLFRPKSNDKTDGLQITVTTEYDLEESHIELDSIQEHQKKEELRK
ncbi:hypothetical protein H0H81_006051, partial [Sphagnurus paluster]